MKSLLLKSSLILILLASPVYGQSANTLSNITVYSQLGIDTIDSVMHENKWKALKCQAIRLGVSNGINYTVKSLVKKERPDKSDFKSFYSNHTSNAFVSSGWRFEFGIPLASVTGMLRIKARKHDWVDVGVGALAGGLSQLLCSKE